MPEERRRAEGGTQGVPSGHDRGEVAAELGYDETVARAMADRYLDDTESRAQKNQFSLFDL
ncbi:hypothetical protein [Rhodococcus sp. YH1]|uniref:hypothetical protein n=1 Tax=Rhodococcus sp. YH1 TaxID=89066 RepID=UPI00138742DB